MEYPKRLTKDKEREYINLYYNLNDINARNKLIEHNMRLVLYIVRRYFRNTKIETDDLVLIGTIGLIHGVDRFDASKGYEISGYLFTCIANEIRLHLSKMKSDKRKISTFYLKSLNEITCDDECELQEIIPDDSANFEINVENKITCDNIIDFLKDNKAFHQMAFEILKYRYFEDKPLKEIAEILNISVQRVSKIELDTIKKLRLVLV